MARDVRTDFEGAIHHVYTRGTKRWLMFHDDIDRRRFIGILSKVSNRYEVTVLAYCLMDNHIHLVVQSHQAELSAFMRDLKSMYARWFNFRHSSSGPIFEDRFGSKMITSFRQLRRAVRYVHRNPYAIDSGMWLANYMWSSHRSYLGISPSVDWLDPSIALGLFTNYQRTIETPVASDKVQNRVGQRYQPFEQAVSGRVPDTRPVASAPGIADVVVAVARAGKVDVADVDARKRNGLVGIAAVIGIELLGLTPGEVAEPLGYRTVDAVQKARRRCRSRMSKDGALRSTFDAAREMLLATSASEQWPCA